MQVDILHRDNLRIAAASRAALYAHAGAEGRLAQTGDGVLAHFLQSLRQTDGDGRLAFTRRGGVDCCNQYQPAVGAVFEFRVICRADFRFILAVAFQIVFRDTCFCRNGNDRLHCAFLCNL